MRKCWEDLIAIFSHIWNKIVNWIIIGQNTIIKCKIDVFYGPYDYYNYSCSQNSVQWWHSKIQTWAFALQIFKNVVIKIRIMCLCKVVTLPTERLKKKWIIMAWMWNVSHRLMYLTIEFQTYCLLRTPMGYLRGTTLQQEVGPWKW